MDTKDWLEIVAVPLALGVVALLWPHVQAWSQARRFMRLIDRELREVEPYPLQSVADGHWTDHLKKTFLHQKIFGDPGQNRDFLLTIDPDIAYKVSQLWQALESGDSVQWLYYLEQLARREPTEKLQKNLAKWKLLIAEYGHPVAPAGHPIRRHSRAIS